MKWLLSIAFLLTAGPAWAGGNIQFQRGAGGGDISFQRGAGGGNASFELGLSNPTDLTFTASSTNTLTLTWTAAAQTPPTTNYATVVSTNSDFSATAVSSDTTGLTVQARGLLVNRLYYGRVRAQSNSFPASLWSGVRSTATLATVPVTVVSTWTGVTTSSLTVNWSAGDNPAGTTYVCQLSTVSGLGSGTILSSTTLNTNAGFTGLTAGGTYYAQVRAQNLFGIPTSFLSLGSTTTVTSAAIILLTASTGTAGAANPYVWSHTVPAGNNRALIVVCNFTSGGSANVITGITFNTTENMTQGNEADGGPGEMVGQWYLQAPSVTTANISVTWTGTGGAADFIICGGINFQNVKQTGSPVDAVAQAHPLGTNPSTSITIVTNGAWIIDGLESDTNVAPTSTSPQITQWTAAKLTQFAASGVSVKGPMAPGSQTMGWNNGSNDGMHALMAIMPQ